MLRNSAGPCLYIISSATSSAAFENIFAGYNYQFKDLQNLSLSSEEINNNVFVVDWDLLPNLIESVEDEGYQHEMLSHCFAVAPGILSAEEKIKYLEDGIFFIADGPDKINPMIKKLDWLLLKKLSLATKLLQIEKFNNKLQTQRKHIREQNDFLQMAVHDFRSPLSAMIVYAEMLMDGVLDEFEHDKNKPLEIIHQNCNFLINMVNDLLESAKLEAGKKKLTLQRVNFSEVLKKILLSLKGLASEKKITVDSLIEDIPELMGNSQMLERVIINLYSNAVKFTKSGGKILVKLVHKGSHVVFSIQDEGPGISKKDAEQIFEKFNVGDESSISGKGHGLGLAITKSFVELHGGRIFVKSKRHKGSTFIVHLKVNEQNSEILKGEQKKVLILDEKSDLKGLDKLSQIAGHPVEYNRNNGIKLEQVDWKSICGLIINGHLDVSKLNSDLYTMLEQFDTEQVPCHILLDKMPDIQNYEYLKHLNIYFEIKPVNLDEFKNKVSESISLEKDSEP